MSFQEIGKRLNMSEENARVIYKNALLKMKVHMRTHEDWVRLLEELDSMDPVATFIQAAIQYGSLVDRGVMTLPRHEQTAARRSFTRAYSAFKMSYRAFLRSNK